MKALSFVLLVWIGCATLGCSKKSGPSPYTMSVNINGDSTWNTVDINTSTYDIYTYITATRRSTGDQIILTITNMHGVKSYPIQNTGTTININLSNAQYLGYGVISGFEAVTGSITVTKTDQTGIYGSFYFENSGGGGGAASGSFLAPNP